MEGRGLRRISNWPDRPVVNTSPAANSSRLVSNCGAWPSLLTITLPLTELAPPALAEMPNLSRFCAEPIENKAARIAATVPMRIASRAHFILKVSFEITRDGERGVDYTPAYYHVQPVSPALTVSYLSCPNLP